MLAGLLLGYAVTIRYTEALLLLPLYSLDVVRTDGYLGLRTLNTTLDLTRPLQLIGGLRVFEPTLIPQVTPVARFFDQMPPFPIPNLGFGEEGGQFNVSRNGLYIFALEPDVTSPGPFPAPFQIHLAGNVGLPRKLINGAPEFPRGIRLDTLFNHAAPRNLRHHVIDVFLRRLAENRRACDGRRDRVHGDVVRCKLFAERLREADQRGLRR